MAGPKRDELAVQRKRAVLVAVVDPAKKIDKDHVLDELRGLVKTAGVNVVGTTTTLRI